MKYNFDKIIKAIESGKTFSIFVHISPDGDAIGSGLALQHLLTSLNKTAYLCCDDKLDLSTEFLNAKIENDDNKIESSDTLFFIDMSAGYRSGKYQKYLHDKSRKILVIDHHISQEEFGDIIVRDASKSSTAELIFELYNAMNKKINPFVATCLYTGIASDTGCFVHQNTTASCHEAAARLMELKADTVLANYELFSKRPSDYMKIVKFTMKHMKVYDDKLTLVIIKQKDYEKLGKPDSFYFIDALTHYTTDILVIATEKSKNKIKLNMRSRNANVQTLCEKFGGGGHKNAAGGESKETLSKTISKLKELIL